MHRKRIKRQIKLLKQLDKRMPNLRFYMGDFGSHLGTHQPEEDNYCNTSCCQLGVASLDRKFNKQGLIGEWQQRAIGRNGQDLTIRFEESTFTMAGAKFFRLHRLIADHMFSGALDTRKKCIKAWQELLELGEKKFTEKHQFEME